jgi:cell division protein FtsL
VTTVALVLMIAVGVAFQAQRVAGQDRLHEVRIEMRDASRQQAELRAELAEAEAPAQILEAAADLGMVEPAAAVAIAAPLPVAVESVERR